MWRRLIDWVCAALTITCLYAGAVSAADISGEVRVEDGKRLKNLVVYLEPASTESGETPKPPTRIYQRGREFSPSTVVVVKGKAVDFVNDEEREIDHNVYSLSRNNKFDVGLVPKGGSRQVTFPSSGVVKYFCSVHKLMEGVIVVVPSPYFVVLEEPGEFTIRNAPPGDWRVKVSSPHRRYRETPVDIKVGSGPIRNVLVLMKRKR